MNYSLLIYANGCSIAEVGPFWMIQFVYCENVIARANVIAMIAAAKDASRY